MRPLLTKDLPNFLERFEYFTDGEFRCIDVISPSVIKVTLAGQDSARGFDWITVELEFSGVSDAALIESSKLPFIDMSSGINITFNDNKFAFAVDKCYNISNITNSICYIVSSSIKCKEGAF